MLQWLVREDGEGEDRSGERRGNRKESSKQHRQTDRDLREGERERTKRERERERETEVSVYLHCPKLYRLSHPFHGKTSVLPLQKCIIVEVEKEG